MKAQMVKNAVIVPVGAKGGFVVKRPPRPATARRCSTEVVACYRTFIRGAARPHRQHRRRRDRAARRRRALRRRRPLPRRRRRQGHRHVLRHRQRDRRWSTASGSATRSPPAARPATTTRRWASPRAAPGSRSSATSASWARTSRRRTSRSSASATCRATCSATACCSRRHIRLVAAFNHRHVFLDPDPDAATSFAERQRLFELPRSSWARLRRDADLRGRRRLPAHRQVDPALAAGARGARHRGRRRSRPTS